MKRVGVRLCQALRCKPCLVLQTDKGCDEAEALRCKRRVEFHTTLPGRLPQRRARPNGSHPRLSLHSVLRVLPRDLDPADWRSETFPSLTLENSFRQKTGRQFCPHVQTLSRSRLLRSLLPCVAVVGHRAEILPVHLVLPRSY